MPAARISTVRRLDAVGRQIKVIRQQRVLLDADLALLYDVDTKMLVQAVKRNRGRFPVDFMFQLSAREFTDLRSQIVTSSGHGGRRHRPYAFTEHGVAMLSSVLRSRRAIQVNIAIMRAFVRLREVAAHHAQLLEKLAALERKYDGQFAMVFEAIRELMTPVTPPRRRIGFAGQAAREGRKARPGASSTARHSFPSERNAGRVW